MLNYMKIPGASYVDAVILFDDEKPLEIANALERVRRVNPSDRIPVWRWFLGATLRAYIPIGETPSPYPFHLHLQRPS